MTADGMSNPFATKFIHSGRLAFVGLSDDELDRLARILIQQNGNGQIVGRHGVGKTTLTFELEHRVARLCDPESAFRFVRKTIGLRGGVRSAMPTSQTMISESTGGHGCLSGEIDQKSGPTKTVLVLDGIERLSLFQRLALIKNCQRKQIGLLLTCHRSIWGLRTLAELRPDFARFESVFARLAAGQRFELSSGRLREIFDKNDRNMREALMSCYDEFEARRASTAC